MKKTTLVTAMVATTLCAAVTLVAQDAQEASAPSPEALARMQPGPMHEKLAPLVGKWTMSGKWRMSAEAPWQEFEADVEREWILGDRFVQEKVTSEMMGQPFEGLGIIGYDNTRKEFTNVWVENMSTGTWTSAGRLEGDAITFVGENSDAMTGEKNRWGKSIVTLGKDEQSFKGFSKDASGKEFLSMEMTAKRK